MASTTPERHAFSNILPRMGRRSPAEPHRAATVLELFFDLVFVVAVSRAGTTLLTFEEFGSVNVGILGFAMAFVTLWWAWMNFTWFASAYDTDDWLYRILTLVQMAGALIFAAGVNGLADPLHPNFTLVLSGFILMRIAMICQWLRAAHADRAGRSTALSYAAGIGIAQLFWVGYAIFAQAPWTLPLFWVGMVLEFLVPIVSERITKTNWHRGHITERYGLFTLIVLGESVLASTTAVIETTHYVSEHREALTGLIFLCAGGFTTVACMWWVYFSLPQRQLLTGVRTAILWGYGHCAIFGSAAAVAAGIEISLKSLSNPHALHISALQANATFCFPVAIFVGFVWLLIVRPQGNHATNAVTALTAVLLALCSFLPFAVMAVAALMIFLTIFLVGYASKHRARSTQSASVS